MTGKDQDYTQSSGSQHNITDYNVFLTVFWPRVNTLEIP